MMVFLAHSQPAPLGGTSAQVVLKLLNKINQL